MPRAPRWRVWEGAPTPPVSGAQAWPAQAEACARQMSALLTRLRMAMLASCQQVEVDTVAPDMTGVNAAHEVVRRQFPPQRLTASAMDASFADAVVEQSSQGSASRSSAPRGGGGVAHPLTLGPLVPSNLHECYLYIVISEYMYKYTAPPSAPRHGQFDQHVGHCPPTLRIFLRHCLYFTRGILCPSICYTAEGVSRNHEHWTGGVVTPGLHPLLAL